MKKVFFKMMLIILTFATMNSCSKNESDDVFQDLSGKTIGTLNDNQPIITSEKATLINGYKKLALKDNENQDFVDLRIQKFNDNGKELYALCAYTADSTRYATLLVLDNNNNFTLWDDPGSGSMTCATKGCSTSTGCTPINEGLGWKCSSCTSDCTKTTTIQL